MISFFSENIAFDLPQKRRVKHWLKTSVENEGKRVGVVSVIFCSDEYLLQKNRLYLRHDYYTDVITFDYTEGNAIAGDIFISIDTVRVNAETYKEPFERELLRVIVHGMLHLCGYNDQTRAQQKQMREKEDFYLDAL